MGFGILGLAILIVDIWALYDCWTRSLESGPKILWSIAILVFPLLGPIAYFLFGRAK